MYYAGDDSLHSQTDIILDPLFLLDWCESPSVNIGRVEDRLIVRKLDNMTEEEENECSKLYFDFRETQKPGTCDIFMMAAMTNWYISRGFWLWDESYFDKGIIIEDKKIKP